MAYLTRGDQIGSNQTRNEWTEVIIETLNITLQHHSQIMFYECNIWWCQWQSEQYIEIEFQKCYHLGQNWVRLRPWFEVMLWRFYTWTANDKVKTFSWKRGLKSRLKNIVNWKLIKSWSKWCTLMPNYDIKIKISWIVLKYYHLVRTTRTGFQSDCMVGHY